MPTRPIRSVATAALVAGLLCACAASGGRTPADSARAPERASANSGVVTAADIERNPTESIEQLLMSRVPGLMVTRTPGGGVAMQIRGATTIHGNSAPLFVIDGVPMQTGQYSAVLALNPHDIATIEVLRDAGSTAFYGVRGANGVVLIRTKRRD